MSSSTTTRSNSAAMSADIKGMSYALYQMPGDTDGTYAVIKVLNVSSRKVAKQSFPVSRLKIMRPVRDA